MSASTIIKRSSGQRVTGTLYAMSTESPDRTGDIVKASGWQLDSFRKNPICLLQHDHASPVGVWKNVRVERDALVGELELAAAGTSPLIDTVRALVTQGVLRAVSVGFRSIKSTPVAPQSFARVFHEVELLEASLVSVPANADCVAIAKGFGLSDAHFKTLFAAESEGGRSRIGDSSEVILRAKHAILAAKRSALC